jgi:hypothetical protein
MKGVDFALLAGSAMALLIAEQRLAGWPAFVAGVLAFFAVCGALDAL